jgi:hypothetical protein
MTYGSHGIGRSLVDVSESLRYQVSQEMGGTVGLCSRVFARLLRCYNFPLAEKLPKPLAWDQKMAEATIQGLGKQEIIDRNIPGEVSSSLSARTVNVIFTIPCDGPHMRTIEMPLLFVEGRGLRLIICSFNENKEIIGNKKTPWHPLTSKELGLPFLVFQALKEEKHLEPEAAVFTSLGDEGFDLFNKLSESNWPDLPELLLFNKSFTSTNKLFNRYFTCCRCSGCAKCINGFSRCAEWEADAEEGIVKCAQQKPRKLIFASVEEDAFFAGTAAFSSQSFRRIAQQGSSAITFHTWPAYFQTRAQHILGLQYIAAAPSPVSEMQRYGNAFPEPDPDLRMSIASYFVSQLPCPEENNMVSIVFFGGAKDTREAVCCRDALPMATLWFERYGIVDKAAAAAES